MLQIGNYPLQYDLSLLQTIYHRPNRSKNSYTDIPDSMDLVIKDNVTGEKFIETIENPEYTWYRIKNEVFVDYNLAFIEKEKCDEITVPYRKLLKSIAEATGNETFFDNNAENGDYRNNQRLHEHVRVMGSDMNIEDFYRFQFGESYKNAFGPINKSYLDIEVDSRTAKGDFVEPGECPINAVTFIDDRTQTVDRIGVLMGLKFPAGKEMEELAATYSGKLPPVRVSADGAECHLSGLENLAANLWTKTKDRALVSAFVLEFLAKTLEKMTAGADKLFPGLPIVYAGGVMSNRFLQSRLGKREETCFAKPEFSADNAAGIALLCRKTYLKEA